MELKTLIVPAAIALLVGVGTNLLSSDLYDRCSGWAHRLARFGARRLPEDKREQFEEEWLADLEEQPSKTAQLLRSLGIVWASCRIEPVQISGWLVQFIVVQLAVFLAINESMIYYRVTGNIWQLWWGVFMSIFGILATIKIDRARRFQKSKDWAYFLSALSLRQPRKVRRMTTAAMAPSRPSERASSFTA